MHQGIILKQENRDLRAELEIKKQKRARISRQIAHNIGPSVQEAQELV